jgi:hypothetical protein
VSLAQHPYRERELEIGVGNSACFVEHPFDGFLWPGAILEGCVNETVPERGKKREGECHEAKKKNESLQEVGAT